MKCHKQTSTLGIYYSDYREIYERGYPELKQNYEQAFNHYYNACNYEIPEAYEHIANMYQNVI